MAKKKRRTAKQEAVRQPRPSKSYMTFEKVIQRSLNLIALQQPVEEIMALAPQKQSIDLSDMTRASVVLAVAAMDAYFTDVFAERFVPYLKQKGKNQTLIAFLDRAGLDTECALELITMDRPFRRIRTLVETHLERTTTQKMAVIDELFLAYNLKHFSANVEKSRRRKKLLASINILVRRRHNIAHEGDMNSHGRVNSIDPRKIKKRVTDVVTFVAGADEILHKQLPL